MAVEAIFLDQELKNHQKLCRMLEFWILFLPIMNSFRNWLHTAICVEITLKTYHNWCMGHFCFRLWNPEKESCRTLYMIEPNDKAARSFVYEQICPLYPSLWLSLLFYPCVSFSGGLAWKLSVSQLLCPRWSRNFLVNVRSFGVSFCFFYDRKSSVDRSLSR